MSPALPCGPVRAPQAEQILGETMTLQEVQEDTDVYLIPDESITNAKQAYRYIEKLRIPLNLDSHSI